MSGSKFNSNMFPRLLILMGYTVPVLYTPVYFNPLSTNYSLQTLLWNTKYWRFYYCLTAKELYIYICPQLSSLNNQWCMSTIMKTTYSRFWIIDVYICIYSYVGLNANFYWVHSYQFCRYIYTPLVAHVYNHTTYI